MDVDGFVAGCQAALTEHTPSLAVRDVLHELVARPAAFAAQLGPVELGGIRTLHHADDLTILHVAWAPGMSLVPHEHRMWAAIGMYGGQEDNTFFRRTADGRIERSGAKDLPRGDVLLLGDDAIHSVANSGTDLALAIHVYGGDFFATERSEWDRETFEERPRDLAATDREFAAANERWLSARR